MSSIKTNTHNSPQYLNLSLALALIVPLSVGIGHAQQLRQGISVQMAPTTHALAYVAADNADAWIVAVTAEGELYFGVKPATPDQLADEMKATPRHRDQNLYIKADARVPFAQVVRVLQAGREVGFDSPVLLTAQPVASAPGTVMPPNGLEVLIGPPAGRVATVVQLLSSGQPRPLLRINGDEISWSALEDTLRRHFQKGDEKVILLKADEDLPFGHVVQAIDTCRATGARVVLATSPSQ